MLDRSGFGRNINRMIVVHNLGRMARASHNYHDTFKGFPPGTLFDERGRALHGWQTLVLPFLEQQQLYDRIDRKLPWNHPTNLDHFRTPVQEYLSPAAEQETDKAGLSLSHVAGNVRILGGDRRWKLNEFRQGSANVLLAGEAAGNFKPWGYPRSARDPALGIHTTPDGFGSLVRPEGATFVLGDASVRFISKDISPAVLRALSDPQSTEPVPPF
jgi:hypothetical protein